MIKVKVKHKDERSFVVPLPYTLLQTGGWVVTTRPFWRMIASKQATDRESEAEASIYPVPIERKQLRELLRTLKNYKGLTIVEIKSSDGTEIEIKL